MSYPSPMDKRFLRAFLTPSRTLLCGYRLYPWCLKHRLQLTALGHPLIVGGPVSATEVISFARLCAEVGLPAKMGWRDQWRATRLVKGDRLAEAIQDARDHVGVPNWPKFWDQPKTEGGETRGGGVPWALAVIANLTRNGLSLEDALHIPEAQAIWLSTTYSIQGGAKLEILTSEDEALLDDLARARATEDEPKPTV
jgi:hypothetical protein